MLVVLTAASMVAVWYQGKKGRKGKRGGAANKSTAPAAAARADASPAVPMQPDETMVALKQLHERTPVPEAELDESLFAAVDEAADTADADTGAGAGAGAGAGVAADGKGGAPAGDNDNDDDDMDLDWDFSTLEVGEGGSALDMGDAGDGGINWDMGGAVDWGAGDGAGDTEAAPGDEEKWSVDEDGLSLLVNDLQELQVFLQQVCLCNSCADAAQLSHPGAVDSVRLS